MDSIRNCQHNATASPRLPRSSLRAFAAVQPPAIFSFWQHLGSTSFANTQCQLAAASAAERVLAVAAAAAADEPTSSSSRTCSSCFAAASPLQQRGWQ
ncbi:hypothetical protein, conserved [Eimeria necatrix]|uniref:Uncharacterized protein n=1 Tax=Eimeria necatrix TaxID=51315 RepID=U6MHA5_9EIME|nr:hypothetical protein, conserved [Eimeria necatrix]CDJ62453.1 hypothetical protein, conserved [Eimeria necatrix]